MLHRAHRFVERGDRSGLQNELQNDLTVYWTPTPRDEWNGPDFKYVVRYRPSGAEENEYKTVDVTDPYTDHVVLTDSSIQPYQPYDVQVQAVNREGPSKLQPQTHKGYSGEGVPLHPVANFRLLSISSGRSATFSWDPVDRNSMNGELKGYKIVHWHENARAAAPGTQQDNTTMTTESTEDNRMATFYRQRYRRQGGFMMFFFVVFGW
jgi:hypothetical protein